MFLDHMGVNIWCNFGGVTIIQGDTNSQILSTDGKVCVPALLFSFKSCLCALFIAPWWHAKAMGVMHASNSMAEPSFKIR